MIEPASVIRDLRGELEAAVAAGRDEVLRFELGPIELEVQVAVECSTAGSGKVRFWVLEGAAEYTTATTGTQRISLSLTPRLAATGRAPQVAGSAEPGEG